MYHFWVFCAVLITVYGWPLLLVIVGAATFFYSIRAGQNLAREIFPSSWESVKWLNVGLRGLVGLFLGFCLLSFLWFIQRWKEERVELAPNHHDAGLWYLGLAMAGFSIGWLGLGFVFGE